MFTKRCTCPLASRISFENPGYWRSRSASSSFTVAPVAFRVRAPPVAFWTSGGTRTSTAIGVFSLYGYRNRGFDRGLVVRYAAELFVVDELGYGRMIATHLAFRVPPHPDLADVHVQRVEQQQPAVDALADAQDQ